MLFCVCARYSPTYLLYVLPEPPCPHLHTNRGYTRIGNEVEDVTPSSPTNDNRIFYIWNSIVYTEYSIYDDDYVIHVSGDASDASTKWKVRIRTGSSNDLCTSTQSRWCGADKFYGCIKMIWRLDPYDPSTTQPKWRRANLAMVFCLHEARFCWRKSSGGRKMSTRRITFGELFVDTRWFGVILVEYHNSGTLLEFMKKICVNRLTSCLFHTPSQWFTHFRVGSQNRYRWVLYLFGYRFDLINN